MKKKITITGDLGSGKSVVSGFLANKLNCEVMSTGMLQRQLADKYKMSTLELNQYAESHPEIDEIIDNNLKQIGDNSDLYIVDSRLAWFFIPNSFKIYLTVDIDTAVKRIMGDLKRMNEIYVSFDNAKVDILKRKESENMRYIKIYGADCANMENFDVVIDTSETKPEEIADKIIDLYKKENGNMQIPRYWISPKKIIPLQDVRGMSSDDSLLVRDSIKETGYDHSFPIIAIKYYNNYFVYDGHRRLSASLLNKISLIPIIILFNENSILSNGLDIKTYLRDAYKLSFLYDWEDMHQFRYKSYFDSNDFSDNC